MKTVYRASNGIEAHLIKILLTGEGIESFISGDYLQGALGELPAIDAIQVQVNDRDYHMANTLIKQWETSRDSDDDSWIPRELR